MNNLQIPENYHSPLTIRETEVAIKEVKDHFERALAKSLHLTRVSAPLFVRPESGLNDRLHLASKNRKTAKLRSSTLLQNGNVTP